MYKKVSLSIKKSSMTRNPQTLTSPQAFVIESEDVPGVPGGEDLHKPPRPHRRGPAAAKGCAVGAGG